jgi:hypothetical protein
LRDASVHAGLLLVALVKRLSRELFLEGQQGKNASTVLRKLVSVPSAWEGRSLDRALVGPAQQPHHHERRRRFQSSLEGVRQER